MEDVKPTIASLGDDGGAMEARFADLCKTKLNLDEGTLRQSVVLFRETKHVLLANMSAIGSGSPEEIERFWSAFVVYCVTKLSKGRYKQEKEENGVTLCQILKIFKLNVVDFFKEMPQFCLKAGYIISGLYGSNWEKRLEVKELQANIVHLCLLSRYSQEQIFNLVAAVDMYEEFLPWCQLSRIIKRNSDGSFNAELEIGFKFLVESYISHVEMEKPKYIKTTASDSDLFDYLINVWEFNPDPVPGTCDLYFSVDFKFQSPLYRQEVVSRLGASFYDRCRRIYGPPVQVLET